ncbi:zinc finger protein 37 [Manduca sexta]|uniref:zinc finger protein 37 n=1 Tax=Manduca sexta TaxID=7130 RepID=UPI00188F8B59|nr:zinc finger protein 37 [Manduca sexta]
MCEWLSYNEWYDVKLLCGGHAFNAHRVVLASVSTFLRKILISCETDESPTFIVLPDFDLEAVSSVLYYIYNGEVAVHKQKLDRFLDIIKAMQIFVDIKYFTNSCEVRDTRYVVPSVSLERQEIFTLGFTDYKHQRYINIKKGNEIKEILQYSVNKVDSYDKQECYQKRSEPRRSLGNLKSSYGDRQRNSFLRDLYIETYPRNGNVNGQAVSVLAISNECYRAPTSVLLTNANDQHLNASNTLLETYKSATWYPFHLSRAPGLDKEIQCTKRLSKNVTSTQSGIISNSTPNCNDLNNVIQSNDNCKTNLNMWGDRVMPRPDLSLMPIAFKNEMMSEVHLPSIDLTLKKLNPSWNSLLNNWTNKENSKYKLGNGVNTLKIGILNQVLESPWRSRTPNFFKPCRRRTQSIKQHQDEKVMKNYVINDGNNNIQTQMHPDMPLVANSNELPPFIEDYVKSNHKCHICNQVFTSNHMLSAHMKRHTTNARYSCSECGKTFSQLRNFKYHMSIHRGTREFAATCTVCGKYFNDRGYLSSHMKIHRNRKEYKCTQCPKSFNQRVAYNMHMRIHTGVKPHVCEECGKAFSRKMLLKQHQRTHSGERPYSCPHCDKRFADRSNMTLHLRLHTGVKPFSCTLCPKSFTKKHHLKSHLNFHTGSKPYSCPRCKLAFTQSSNMRTHMKKCNVPEPLPHTSAECSQ